LIGGTYAGTYGSGATYTQFQTVTYSGADWICLSTCTGITPAQAAAGAAQYWAQFDSTGSGLTATQADAAFFSSWGQVQAGATGFGANSGVSLIFGNRPGGYNKNGDWVMPTNTFGYTISIFGQGRGGTWIHQTASTLNFMVNSPNVSSSTGQTISGITLDANLLAGGCLSHHLRRSLISDLACWNPQQQASGTIGAPMWLGQGADAYETLYQHLLVRGPAYSGLVAAYGTATVTSGAITAITWGSTGTNLNLPVSAGPGLVAYFLGKGPTSSSYQPCGAMPVVSAIALTGGSINTAVGVGGITFTSSGTSCGGTIYVRVQQAGTLNEGYYLGGSDTTVDDIVTSGDFKVACEYVNGPFSLKHEHPYCAAPYQIEAAGSGVANFTAPEMDSPVQYGMYIVGSGATVQGGFTEFNAGNQYGAGDYLIDAGANNFSIASSGCYSGSVQNFGGYAKYTGTAAGPLTPASVALPASASLSGVQENCDGSASLWGIYPAGGGANFPSSPGVVYNTTTAAARNATPSDFLSLVGYYTGTYSSGVTYKFDDIAADGSGNNYVSLSAGNAGNALTNTTYWHFLGGLSSTITGGNCVTSGNYMSGISTTGVPACGQVQFSNLGGSSTVAQLPTGTSGATVPLNNTANVNSQAQTAPAFFLQTRAAGPYASFFDDFFSTANNSANVINGSGTAAGDGCVANNTYADANHPGNILLTSGTGGTTTGVTCGLQSTSGAVVGANTSAGWTWETAVYLPVLPGTTAGAYQAGLSGSPNSSPWTNGIGFYLSSANGTANDWYIRYGSTATDCTIAATAATWARLTMVNDGTNVHWYVNGSQCGTGVAIGSMPSGTMYAASWSAVGLSSSSVTMAVDYVDFQRAVTR
jgi:hypothetical protein